MAVNFNKLLPRISIRAKLVIAFCLFAAVPVAVVGGYGAFHSFLLLNQGVRDRLSAEVGMKAEEIRHFLDEVRADVLFLSRLPTLRDLITVETDRRAAAPRVEEAFLSFARSRPAYDQIRYVDERGMEIVRVDADGDRPRLVGRAELQDKSDRYYFREAMATPKGAIYASPMDLNIERGAVEVPHKPVVRYAAALQGPGGEPRGVVIINVLASHILRRALALRHETGDVALVSSAGLYLSRSEWLRGGREARDFRFPATLASWAERVKPSEAVATASPAERLASDFSAPIAAGILSGTRGSIVEAGLRGRIVAFAPILPERDRQAFWVLVHAYAKTDILSSIRWLQIMVLALGGASLGIALVAGLAAARHFMRPITELQRSAEAIAQGDFDRPIRVETNDELEDLGRQFVLMAGSLKEHERQLRDARQRAERKAREAQALSRIATEMLALLSLPQVLQLVADKARDLLGADVAILSLGAPGEELRLAAVSGAAESLDLGTGDLLPGLPCAPVVCPYQACPVLPASRFPRHVSVVMKSEERVLGYLCVGHRAMRCADRDEREFLAGLASQAAIAIEKARLHQEVRTLARLEERERIAQDLHDGIIQSIYATGLGVEECLRLIEESPADVRPKLEGTIERLNAVIRDVRNYVVGLQPESLQERSLGAALRDLARDLELNGLLHVALEVEPEVDRALTAEQTGHLLHICREALANVVRHSGSARAVLKLARLNATLHLDVADEGVGFDPARQRATGHGLRNIRERARRLGGALTIDSAPGRGTRVKLEMPVGEGRGGGGKAAKLVGEVVKPVGEGR